MKVLLANFTKMVNDSGGMAKVTCNMANELDARGYDVSLVYSDEKRGEFYYKISKNVKKYDLRHLGNENIKFPIRLKIKREFLRIFNKQKSRTVGVEFDKKYLSQRCQRILDEINPDIIVSFNPGTSAMLICTLKINIPIITMSHGDPEDYFQFYPEESVQAVAESTVNQVLLPSFEQHIKNHLPNANVVTIANAIPQYECSADLDTDKKIYKIIFVGRLTKNHKRPHLLIQAFSEIAEKYPDWILELWGAKEREIYYKELEYLIKKSRLQNRVFLKGTTNQVQDVLKQADIFAFPSAYEGFGMALAEGMSMGLPSVGYKNCPAVNELIKDGINGFLCDDGVEPFARALDKLMEDKELRIKMGKTAKDDMAQYAPEHIWSQWEQLIVDTVNSNI